MADKLWAPWQGRNNTCRLYGSVAQSVEQGSENPHVAGSIPAGTTNVQVDLIIDFEFIIPSDW